MKQASLDTFVGQRRPSAYVTVDRSPLEQLSGFVVGASLKWLLIHKEDNVRLDGYVAIRTNDVHSINPDEDAFSARALAHYGERPAKPSGLALDSIQTLLNSAGRQFTLVSLYLERLHEDECYIGAIDSINSRSVKLREIDPNGAWGDDISSWNLKDVTRVEFGGHYEQALLDVGGPI